jgi:deoxyribodipyrimidine photo-lyase
MQAGTTGINTIRIYNPIKQSYDQDPDGIFIKKWIPELRSYPKEFIHEPWKLSEMEKIFYNLDTLKYPDPIINIEEAGKIARDKIWSFRKRPEVQADKARILETHTRNDNKRRKEA